MGFYGRGLSIVIRMFRGLRSYGKHSRIMLNGREALRVLPESGSIRGTLLAVHGMTAKGNEDSRIHVLASAFAAIPWMSYAELLAQDKQFMASLQNWKTTLSLNVPENDNAATYFKKILALPIPIESVIEHLNFERRDRMLQLARVLSDQGEIDYAQKLLVPFLEKDEHMQLLMAELYLKQNKAAQAWDILQHHRPKNCRLAKLSAKSLLLSGLSKEAIRYYRIAMDHCGANKSLSRMLLIARLIEGEERAIMEALHLLRTKSKNTRIRRLVLHNLALNGDYQSMIPHLQKLKEQQKITPEESDDLQRILYGLPLEYYPLSTP